MGGRRPLIAGNWKMNGLAADALARAEALARRARDEAPRAEVVVCPPATLLRLVGGALAGLPVDLGGQDCHAAAAGAHTGDISAAMLADAGCRFVIIGHSERRAAYGETDAGTRVKAEAARAAGLVAIVCVGESAAERDAGRTLDVIESQVAGSVPGGADGKNTVVAYEPVWAIGSGRTPSEAEVGEVLGHIRATLRRPDIRLLYGGSVGPANAAPLLRLEDCDGALVGGASLDVDDFWGIVRSCP